MPGNRPMQRRIVSASLHSRISILAYHRVVRNEELARSQTWVCPQHIVGLTGMRLAFNVTDGLKMTAREK